MLEHAILPDCATKFAEVETGLNSTTLDHGRPCLITVVHVRLRSSNSCFRCLMPDRSVILARPWSIDQRTTVGHSRPRSIGAQLLEWPTLLDNIWQMFRYVAFGILQFSPVMLARRCQFFVFEVQYRWPALPPPSVLVANIYATKPSCSHRRRHHQQHHLAVVAEMSRTIWYQTLFLPGGTSDGIGKGEFPPCWSLPKVEVLYR